MTSLKQRARDLLHSEDLRGRVPEEVQDFLRDVVALEPVAIASSMPGASGFTMSAFTAVDVPVNTNVYTLGADHDPA